MRKNVKMLTNQQQLELAETPTTPASILEELAGNSEDKEILRAIAQNPNSPPDLLVELAREYLEEIGQNPALDLILLEDPGVAQRMFDRFYWRYKKSYLPKISPILVRLWSKSLDEITRTWVAGYKHAPGDIFVTLYKNRSWKVREKISKNPATPAFILRKIICKDKYFKNKKAALVNLLLLEWLWNPECSFDRIITLHLIIVAFFNWGVIYLIYLVYAPIAGESYFKICGIIGGIITFISVLHMLLFYRGNSFKELAEDIKKDWQKRSYGNRFERIELTVSVINNVSFLSFAFFNLAAFLLFPIFVL